MTITTGSEKGLTQRISDLFAEVAELRIIDQIIGMEEAHNFISPLTARLYVYAFTKGANPGMDIPYRPGEKELFERNLVTPLYQLLEKMGQAYDGDKTCQTLFLNLGKEPYEKLCHFLEICYGRALLDDTHFSLARRVVTERKSTPLGERDFVHRAAAETLSPLKIFPRTWAPPAA